MKHRQEGFTLVEGLLVVIAATLIIFTGWYVWDSRQDETKPTATTIQTKPETSVQETDPVAGWKPFSTTKFSLAYPTTWSLPANLDMCGDDFFMAGPTKDTTGACASDGGGQIIVSTYTVESGPQGLQEAYYDDFTTQLVTIQGVTGTKESGTVKEEPIGIGPPKGTMEISYLFKSNGTFYHAMYSQRPGSPDVLKEFDLMVTKTLRFK